MVGRTLIGLWVALLLVPALYAGEPQVLPASERSFQEKIRALVKPGQTVDEALKILAPYRFECREFQNKYPVIHCSRMDAPRYYQVLIEPTQGDRVKTVEPSIGMVRQ